MKPSTGIWPIAVLAALLASDAAGQSGRQAGIGAYPERPLRFVTGFLPGGVSDTIARIVGSKLGERLNQRVIIDGRPGAGGQVGMTIAASATPDGYTFYLGQPVITLSPLFKNKPPYDPIKAFAPVVHLGNGPTLLVVHPSLPINSVKDLIAYAKSRPEGLLFGSSGAGSTNHLAGELFKVMASVPLVHVPYKGAAANAVAVMQGEIGMAFQPLAAAIPQVKAGRLKGIAVTGAKRARAVPEIPTVGETLPGYQVVAWYGMLVPAGTPRAVVAYLNQQTNQVLAMPEVADTLMRNGIEPEGGTPEAFARLINEDAASMAKLVKDAGIKFD
jgi:tripartite-type tricarboxylate transporter receptor subunit TctC